MSVSLCIRARRIEADTIARMLVALVEINVAIYERREVIVAPWPTRNSPGIVWEPDAADNVATLHDASILHERGYGSCGELAAAYAAWLAVHHHGAKTMQLLSNGPDAWHVTATRGRTVYDPQILGARRHAANT